MDEQRLFAEWERELSDDPGYIAHGLLCELTEDICRAMDQQGITRTELADRLGVSRQYITNFLNTPQNTTLKQIVRFANAVGLEVAMSLTPRGEPSRSEGSAEEARLRDG